jgi:hypothetical protein
MLRNGVGGQHESVVDESDVKNGGNGASVLSHGLSKRGSKALTPFSCYIQAVNDAKSRQWSHTNPDGYFLVSSVPPILVVCFVLV